ncbi:hypothetical protein YC2023_052008 [Brassica napus]
MDNVDFGLVATGLILIRELLGIKQKLLTVKKTVRTNIHAPPPPPQESGKEHTAEHIDRDDYWN